ncbi:hypothetical protein MASR1M65_18180 [Saprospiraceae bacterium]
MLSKILIFICALIAISVLYLSWTIDTDYSTWIIAPVVIGTTALVLAPQIDWWWLKRYPPKTDEQIVRMFEKHLPVFAAQPGPGKAFLLQRTELFMKAFDWNPQGFETIPADVQYVLSFYAAWLTRQRQNFLLKNWEKVILYKNPFPSPAFPRQFHNSEIYHEDHVMIFNIQAVMNGFLRPDLQFPVGLYELARIYCNVFGLNITTADRSITPSNIKSVTGAEWQWVTSGIGLDEVDPDGLAIVCYHFFNHQVLRGTARGTPTLSARVRLMAKISFECHISVLTASYIVTFSSSGRTPTGRAIRLTLCRLLSLTHFI